MAAIATKNCSSNKMPQNPHNNCESNKNYCIICASYVVRDKRHEAAKIKHLYENAFKKKMPEGKWYIPTICCKNCVSNLYALNRKQLPSIRIVTPAAWKLPKTGPQCFFCTSKPFKGKGKPEIANLPTVKMSTKRPKETGKYKRKPKESVQTKTPGEEINADNDIEWLPTCKYKQNAAAKLEPLSRAEMSDLIKEFEIGKKSGKIILSRLKHRGFVEKGTKWSDLVSQTNKFEKFYEYNSEYDIVYCKNIEDLMRAHELKFEPKEWRLFSDSNSKSLVVVLLSNGNKKPSVLLAYSRNPDESYERMNFVLEKLEGSDRFKFVADFKMLNILSGIQGGYPTYMCLFCLFNTRKKEDHWKVEKWPDRDPEIGKTFDSAT